MSESQIVIGISKGSGDTKYAQYERWLKAADASIHCLDLSLLPPEEAVRELNRCSALVLTGGSDIDPELYGKPDERAKCKDIDRPRDRFEFALIQRARLINIPILAICRGMQLFNVFLGGTLIVDIATEKPDALVHRNEEGTATHPIAIDPTSLLKTITGADEAIVNSTHHQAVDKLSWYLKPIATASDGIVEAFEWNDQKEKPFLLALQWHPERMMESPMSTALALSFIAAAKDYFPHHRVD